MPWVNWARSILQEFLQPILQGGAIIISICSIYWAWQIFREEKKLTKARVEMLRNIMMFSVAMLLLCGFSEIAYRYVGLRSKATESAMLRVAVDTFLNTIMQPRKSTETSSYAYLNRAPNGLEKIIDTDPIFQDFSTKYMVQRLWADPRYEDCFIRAFRPAEQKCLVIDFIRKGEWGCDVSIKNKNNKVLFTEPFKSLVIKLQADTTSLKQLKKAGSDAIGFRIRIVDGSNNHWSWGSSNEMNGQHPVDYATLDSEGKPLRLEHDSLHTFKFDIISRKKWAFFESDGGIAPIQSRYQRFKFIQMVVIEPGVISRTRTITDKNSNPYYHKRELQDSPFSEDRQRIKGSIIIQEIHFI